MRAQIGPRHLGTCVGVLLAVASAAHAATLTVKADGTGVYATIKAALDAAVNGDVLVLEPGVYINFGNQDLTLQNKILTVRSQDPNDPAVVAATVIDCQGDALNWSTHWWLGAQSTGATTKLTVRGLTIRNGWDVADGCAIRCNDAALDVSDCVFQNNKTFNSRGAAVACTRGQARFIRCTFLDNACLKEGDPLVAEGGILYPSLLHGGVLYASGSQLEFTDCQLEGNSGCALETLECQLTLTRCLFQNNEGEDGGAIRCRGSMAPEKTTLVLTDCTFVDNSSSTGGGALYLYNAKTVTISNCIFRNNKATQDGGAIYHYQWNPTLTNCLFVGNQAGGQGGAFETLAVGSPSLTLCTLVANTAAKGGAVAARGGGNPVLSQCILWDNTAVQGSSVYVGLYPWTTPQTATATVKYCDVEGGLNGTFADAGCGLTWDSATNKNSDPLFLAPGAPNYDCHLLAASPCVNAGDPAYVVPAGQTDLDGHPRWTGLTVDLGAYEFQNNSFSLIVNNGTGGGQYSAGQVQAISANPDPAGKKFDRWTGDTPYLANAYLRDTTVTMPAANVTVTATYVDAAPGRKLYDWNGDGIISITGDVPLFVQCLYFDNCPAGVDLLAVGDGNHDGILSIAGDVPCFVNCVYFGNGCPQ